MVLSISPRNGSWVRKTTSEAAIAPRRKATRVQFRISPDTAFSVNDWTAFVIFITVIGGIGRIEGPIIGTIIFFILRQTLADLGSIYLLMMGAVAIVVMLWAPKGLWGLIAERFGWQALPLQRRLVIEEETGGKP